MEKEQETITQQQQQIELLKNEIEDNKFDRQLRIWAGVITVLGTAATTIMTIMEAEKEVRKRVKGKKPRLKRAKTVKALKAPSKEHRLRARRKKNGRKNKKVSSS
jgi:thiamine phosphate synthase YjbQ (UPF0047 family)